MSRNAPGFEFTLSKPNKGFPVGEYHVDIAINGKVAKSAKFTVAP